MDLFSVLVTGGNRGIGLEFVRQLTRLPKPPSFVFATYRSSNSLGPLTEIKDASKASKVIPVKMDVNVPEQIAAARKVVQETVGENGLTLLINNAGVCERNSFPNITEESLLKHFNINVVGPVLVFQEMLPLLQKAASRKTGGLCASRAAVLNIGALLGSITNTGTEFDTTVASYKTSKAALNMAMKVIAATVKDQGIFVVTMCPGWVKTDMGTSAAELTPKESISDMLKTLEKLDDSHHGLFMDRLGKMSPF